MNLETLRSFCLSLPHATEGIKWDHLTFMIGEKIFLLTSLEEEGETAIKVSEEDFDMLTERDGCTQAPHFAKRKWINITRRNGLRKDEWQEYIRRSYELVKSGLPKKVQTALNTVPTSSGASS